MVFIDGTVVSVALPVLQHDLHATVADVQWVVEAYALFLAALLLVGGSLGDKLGRRRIFLVGAGIFTFASVACGFAPNINFLIAARAVQGVGGALLTPSSLAIITASFSADKRGQAIGTWSGFTSITSAIGPLLGGVLVQFASWRFVFLINVPLAVLVFTISLWKLPESTESESSSNLDFAGATLATIGLGAFVFGLITGGSDGLGSPGALAGIIIGSAALIGFVIVESRSAAPMMPLNLFRSRTFAGANLLTLLLYAGLAGALFFVPFNLIQIHGYPASAAGAANLPFVLIVFSLSRWSGGLIARYGARIPLIIGPCIDALGFLLFARIGADGSYWTTFFPASIVLGIGMAITIAPLTTAVMGAVDSHLAGIASGVNNAVSRTAGLLAVAIFGIVVVAVFGSSLDSHLAMLHLSPAVMNAIDAQKTKLGSIEIPSTLSAQMHATIHSAIGAAFTDGFRVSMIIAAVLALASAVMSWALLDNKPVSKQPNT